MNKISLEVLQLAYIPIKKWPGIIISIPSSSESLAIKGRLFKHASICVRIVQHSSKVVLTLAVTRFRWNFKLLTAATQMPPKWGDLLGINLHCILCEVQNWETSAWVFWSWRNVANSLSSFLAPTKLLPWSLWISDGLPRLEINLRKAVMNASVVKSN